MSDNDVMGGNAQEKLKSYARRLGNILDDQATLAEDKKELLKEVKEDGFTPKILNEALKRIRADKVERDKFEAEVATYMHAINGDLFDDDSGVTMTMRVGDGPESAPFTTADLKHATQKLSS